MAFKRAVPVILLTVAISSCLFSAQGDHVYVSHGVHDVPENGSGTFLCGAEPGLTPLNVSWTIVPSSASSNNTTLPLGTCDAEFRCASAHRGAYPRSARGALPSISLENVRRDVGGQLSCSRTYVANGVVSYRTLLNVYNRPVLENCSVGTTRRNWSALMSCEVSAIFSTAHLYTFQVLETYPPQNDPKFPCYNEIPRGIQFDSWKTASPLIVQHIASNGTADDLPFSLACVFHPRKSFSSALSSYINDTDNRLYYRGRLEYSWPLRSFPTEMSSLYFLVCAGFQESACVRSVRNISRISTPSTPRHNCTDLHYLPETGGIPCLCTADDLGSPAGRLMWMRGDVAMVTGEYGVRHLSLPADLVTREMDRQRVACQLDWVKPQRVIVPLNVAYGPDRVDLRIYQQYRNKQQSLTVIECHVTGLNPRAPDMVQWEGPCQGQAGFTCTLDPKDREVQGKAVRCRVTNTHNNGHTAEAADTIHTVFLRPMTKAADSSGSDRLKWAAIGAGATVVVAVVVAALAVAMLRASRHCDAYHPYHKLPAFSDPETEAS